MVYKKTIERGDLKQSCWEQFAGSYLSYKLGRFHIYIQRQIIGAFISLSAF